MDFLNNLNSGHSVVFVFLRAIIIYVYAVFLIRIGNKRFHIETGFDFILIIIIGSVMSRGINSSTTLLEALVGSTTLIILHLIFAILSFYSHKIGKIIKGEATLLIKNGELDWERLKQNQITLEDIREMCREKLNHNNLEKIKEARLERTGRISFIENK